MAHQLKTQGIVLARIDFGEADRILTVLTDNFGKISLLSRGARKAKSKLAGGIELFSESQISFIKGRGEISTLTSSRLITHYGSIVSDINRTMLGYKLLKVISKTIEDGSGQEYYQTLIKALDSLNDLELSQALVELWFYMQILKISGHTPNFEDKGEGKYLFDHSSFKFVTQDSGIFNSRHIKLLRLVLRSAEPKVLSNVKDIDELLDQCLVLTKTMINYLFPSSKI